MAYGLQVFSGINGNALIDGSKPHRGMCTAASGTVGHVSRNSNPAGVGVVFQDGDFVLFNPTGTVASGTSFLVTGNTIAYSGDYKIMFDIRPISGVPPTTVDYVVLRPSDNVTSSEAYGLQVFHYVGQTAITVFDSRTFSTADEMDISNITTRFFHTNVIGTINNGEWYSTSSMQWVQATGAVQDIGIIYSNNSAGSYDSNGPNPSIFSGVGIFHHGQSRDNQGTYERFRSDYMVQGKKILGN